MKMFIKALCCSLVLTVLFSMLPFEASCQEIKDDVFRLHILANSDSDEDQSLKLKVRDEILRFTESLYKNSGSKEEALRLTKDNLQAIANRAKQVICDSGYDYSVTAEISQEYFDTRTYENVTMPSGTYQALRIIIGEGKGHNWWCVMYPSLCVGASTDYDALEKNMNDSEIQLLTKEKCTYKFKIVEYFEKFKSFFE